MAVLALDEWCLRNYVLYARICSECKASNDTVKWRTAATAYDDPKENEPLLLCDDCAEDYYAYWKAMWEEYRAGRL